MQLSPMQVAEFEERGYLVLPGVFDESECAEMGREADRMLTLMLNASLATGQKDPRLDASDIDGRLDIRKVQPVNDLSDAIRKASEDERLIGPMCQLMGAEPILMEEKLNYKQVVDCPEYIAQFQPRKDRAQFQLHHDWGYYRAQGYPENIISSAITMDACTHENGPLRVIPGTHREDFPLKYPDRTGNGEVADGLFAEEARVDVVAPPGSVMLFHAKLLHDSKPNQTGKPRRLMIYSHYPGTHKFPEDARNRAGRLAGQAVEDAYRQKKSEGWRDVFTG